MFTKSLSWLIVAGILSISLPASAGSISGVLKMPTPYSQATDMAVFIRANSQTTTDQSQTFITITSAEAAAGFEKAFTISGLNPGENYRLRYDCNSFNFPEVCENVVASGWYEAQGVTGVREENAADFAGAEDHGDNMPGGDVPIILQVIDGRKITGTMSMPSGTAPVDGLLYLINAEAVALPRTLLAVEGTILQGASSDTFTLTIPDDGNEMWKISYLCQQFQNPNGACDDYLPQGFHATASTVEDSDDATPLPGNADSSGTDMTFLTGFSISGTLSVPAAPTHPDGIDVRVVVTDNLNIPATFETSINIPMGATSRPYSVTMSLDPNAEWTVRYACKSDSTPDECAKYLSQGYYDGDTPTTMTVESLNDAETLDGGESYSNIDFSMISGFSISGTLALSDGVAPSGGLNFSILATNTSGSGGGANTTGTIDAGQTETDFKINIPTDGGATWRVQFDCNEVMTPSCAQITDTAFWDHDNRVTVATEGESSPVPGGMDTINVDLVVDSPALAEGDLCVPVTTPNGVALICL